MQKATQSLSTPASRPSITEAATIPSRRRLLAGSGLVAALAAVGLSAAPTTAAQIDPVVAIYVQWRVVEDAAKDTNARHADMRAGFVERHGDIRLDNPVAYAAWKTDPLSAEFDALRERSNALCDESTDLLDAMMEAPATSLEGIHCKVLAALTVWSFIDGPNVDPDNVEYHDTMTVTLLRDAARVLGGRTGA